MKCLVFSKTLQFGSSSNSSQPCQPKNDIITNETITIQPTSLV